MARDLEALLRQIDDERARHLVLGKATFEADGGKLFSLDFWAGAAINRSLSNCFAFTQMVRTENYLAAASLVRLQLDTFLRFFASYLVNDPHEFTTSVLAGTEVRKLKDRSGKPMTDRHLVDAVAAEFPWVPSVYKQTSGFIHLSDKHVFGTIQSVDDDGVLSMHIGSDPRRFPDELGVEMAEGFIAATDALCQYLQGWAYTKENPQLVESARTHLGES